MGSSPKIAIVTGAGSGIGKHVAVALARNGYAVVLVGRRQEPLETTALAVSQDNSQTLVVPADVNDPSSVRELFAKTKRAYGRLDLLFNNAGISGRDVPLEDLTYEEWKSVVDTNLTGTFLCTQEAFKIMKSQEPVAGASSTTARFRRTTLGRIPPSIRQQSTELPVSPKRLHLTVESTTSPAVRSTLETRRRKWRKK